MFDSEIELLNKISFEKDGLKLRYFVSKRIEESPCMPLTYDACFVL